MGHVEYGPWEETGQCEHGKPIMSRMRCSVSTSFDPVNTDPSHTNYSFERRYECEICKRKLDAQRKRKEFREKLLNSRFGACLVPAIMLVIILLFIIAGCLGLAWIANG